MWSQWLWSSVPPLTRKYLWGRVLISLSRWWQGKSKLCRNSLTFFLLPGIKKNTTGSAMLRISSSWLCNQNFLTHFTVQGGAILAPNLTTLWVSVATVWKRHTNRNHGGHQFQRGEFTSAKMRLRETKGRLRTKTLLWVYDACALQNTKKTEFDDKHLDSLSQI